MFHENHQSSTELHEKRRKWLFSFFLLGEYTTSYVGIITSHYKDPYKPISIMDCHKGFKRCSTDDFVWGEFDLHSLQDFIHRRVSQRSKRFHENILVD